MTKIAERLKEIRVANRYSQKQIADMCGMAQATIGRYETDAADPSPETLLWYAETFEVSLDYIFGRTDDPKGHLYEKDEPSLPSNASINDFIEFCFDPSSPANAKLKKMLVQLMQDSTKQPD